MGLLERCVGFTEARSAMRDGRYPYFLALDESAGPEVVLHGRRLVMAGSNNYLGLTVDPRVQEAAIAAIRRYGTSCTGSRFMNGTLALHEELEGRLARFLGKQAAVCFATGFQGCLGILSALAGRGDLILLDKEAHASLYDGARLSLGRMRRFGHNDMVALAGFLDGAPPGGDRLVAVDGVFSMSGDLAPLPELSALCRRHGAWLVVDDAHGIGVMGGGRGTEADYGLTDAVSLTVGTFSKALASLGGFVAGDEVVIHYLKHHARSLIFSAAIPPANAAAALAALGIVEAEPERIVTLHRHAGRMRRELSGLGFDTGGSGSPIVPVVMGERMLAVAAARALRDAGILVYPVMPPAVAPRRCLLRVSAMATHTEAHIDQILTAFAKVGRQLGVIG
jgi:8-amino-7-oxononanoate synthase